LVVCGVPAIIGGGIIYAVFGRFAPVFIFEILLLFLAGAIVTKKRNLP